MVQVLRRSKMIRLWRPSFWDQHLPGIPSKDRPVGSKKKHFQLYNCTFRLHIWHRENLLIAIHAKNLKQHHTRLCSELSKMDTLAVVVGRCECVCVCVRALLSACVSCLCIIFYFYRHRRNSRFVSMFTRRTRRGIKLWGKQTIYERLAERVRARPLDTYSTGWGQKQWREEKNRPNETEKMKSQTSSEKGCRRDLLAFCLSDGEMSAPACPRVPRFSNWPAHKKHNLSYRLKNSMKMLNIGRHLVCAFVDWTDLESLTPSKRSICCAHSTASR